jgi:hypothetical protein
MGRPAVRAREVRHQDLITNYIVELADAIEQAAAVDESVIAPTEKLAIFRRASLCFDAPR